MPAHRRRSLWLFTTTVSMSPSTASPWCATTRLLTMLMWNFRSTTPLLLPNVASIMFVRWKNRTELKPLRCSTVVEDHRAMAKFVVLRRWKGKLAKLPPIAALLSLATTWWIKERCHSFNHYATALCASPQTMKEGQRLDIRGASMAIVVESGSYTKGNEGFLQGACSGGDVVKIFTWRSNVVVVRRGHVFSVVLMFVSQLSSEFQIHLTWDSLLLPSSKLTISAHSVDSKLGNWGDKEFRVNVTWDVLLLPCLCTRLTRN